MFFDYVKDKISWLLFFGCALAFVNLLIWLDKGLAVKTGSLLYLNILLAGAFVFFFVWRYRKETVFLRELKLVTDQLSNGWQEALPEAVFANEDAIKKLLQLTAKDYELKLIEFKSAMVLESDYTAAWVHEVKAPLTAMKLTMDAHRHEPVMRKLEADWLRVHLLIDRQLYISRLPMLSADYIVEQVTGSELLIPEVRELQSWCLEKNIAIEIEESGIETATDRKWCRFIIRQILTNAVKYSPPGGVIWISMNRSASGRPVVTIRDEGRGIPAHDLPRVFDKGFTGGAGRLHNSATGLGLYLANQVAEKIGISLHIQSEPNKGTAVQMTFSTENEFDATRT